MSGETWTGNGYADGPVWNAFGLTYSAYAVYPRRALQSMPVEWQERFVALVDEMHELLPPGALDADYTVRMRVNGRFAPDPLADYRHTEPLLIAHPPTEQSLSVAGDDA